MFFEAKLVEARRSTLIAMLNSFQHPPRRLRWTGWFGGRLPIAALSACFRMDPETSSG